MDPGSEIAEVSRFCEFRVSHKGHIMQGDNRSTGVARCPDKVWKMIDVGFSGDSLEWGPVKTFPSLLDQRPRTPPEGALPCPGYVQRRTSALEIKVKEAEFMIREQRCQMLGQ